MIKSTLISSSQNDEAKANLLQNYPKMNACFMLLNSKKNFTSQQIDSVIAQFDKFLRKEGQEHVLYAVAHWLRSSATYSTLGLLTERVLCVPATSAPVERIFNSISIQFNLFVHLSSISRNLTTNKK